MLALSWLALVSFLSFSPADAVAAHIRRSNGPSVPDSYIIVLKSGTNRTAHIQDVSGTFSIADTMNSITVSRRYSKALLGYSAKLKGAALERVAASPDVDYITEDGIASILAGAPSTGPAMIDAFGRRAAAPANGTDGAGVDVYGIDTGIYIAHNDFGGRATWGATFGDYEDIDDNGHGTHTASTAVGAQYGIAKAAAIIAVKVLDSAGNGAYSDIIAGIEWVMNAAIASGKPSVANMSLGGPSSDAIDQAVNNAIEAGVHFAVAAGNAGEDADGTSPARVPAANTIGAVDITNKIASFSNIGPDVDVFALGVNVTAAWITGPEATKALSGTSMASPRVAGLLAVALSKQSRKSTPAALSNMLVSNAEPVVTGQPTNTTDLLAQDFS